MDWNRQTDRQDSSLLQPLYWHTTTHVACQHIHSYSFHSFTHLLTQSVFLATPLTYKQASASTWAVTSCIITHSVTPEQRTLGKTDTIRQITTMLATFKNVLFPGHSHLYWWPFTLTITRAPVRVIIKVKGHQHWWLAGGYDLEIGHFRAG